MKLCNHKWYYFKIPPQNGKKRYCQRCGKHQTKDYLDLFGWETIYSFDWQTHWGFSFLEALNCWCNLPEERQEQIERLYHKQFTNDDIANWYMGFLK